MFIAIFIGTIINVQLLLLLVFSEQHDSPGSIVYTELTLFQEKIEGTVLFVVYIFVLMMNRYNLIINLCLNNFNCSLYQIISVLEN